MAEDYNHILETGRLRDVLLEAQADDDTADRVILRCKDADGNLTSMWVIQSFTGAAPGSLDGEDLDLTRDEVLAKAVEGGGQWSSYLHHKEADKTGAPLGIITVTLSNLVLTMKDLGIDEIQ